MTTPPLHRHLAASELFASLSEDLLAELEPELSLLRLSAGDVLLRQGDPAEDMYVLMSGELVVSIATEEGGELTVDRLGPGASVGEMALVVAQRRSATVSATAPSELVRLSRADFQDLALAQPALVEAVVRATEPRLQRVQLGAVLEQWFDSPDEPAVRRLQKEVGWTHLGAGEELFDQGDPADGMFLVVSGRIRLERRDGHGSVRLVGEVGRGGSLGEEGVLAGEFRGERAFALRDSHLVRLTEGMADAHPSVFKEAARSLLGRGRHGRHAGQLAKTFALVPIGDPTARDRVGRDLEAHLERWGSTLGLDAAAVDRALGRDGASQSERASVFDPPLAHWLNERELEQGHVLLHTDPRDTPWTRRALRQSDIVLLVAPATASAERGDLEAAISDDHADIHLVLVHPPATERPSNTAAWSGPRPGVKVHHVREGHDGDLARLARRITGRAHGLVLSGGGARGYVHIGLLQALEELEVPIDFVAGTSMGAVVGGAFALTHSHEYCYETAKTFGDPSRLLDRTLPIVALNRSKAVTELYETMYQGAQIEDLWTPFFCVSANLTRAEPVVHSSGPLWKAVRASSAIPGVFTPLLLNGDVLVDGGVMNNFPVDLMRERVGTGTVIGSNAYMQSAKTKDYRFGPSVSGWQVLKERILPFQEKHPYPSILATLMRATSLSSHHLSETAHNVADLVIRYPTQEFGSLQFDAYKELTELGYEVARGEVEGWLAGREGNEA